jgi:acyl dehydratase
MPNAVRPDDTLDLELTIVEKRESKSKSDRGVLRLRIYLRNQRVETVLGCIVTVLIRRRPNA